MTNKGPGKKIKNAVKKVRLARLDRVAKRQAKKSSRDSSTPLARSPQSRPMTINNPAPTITMKKPRMSPIKDTPKRPKSPVAKRDTPLPTSTTPELITMPYPRNSKPSGMVTMPSPRNSGKKSGLVTMPSPRNSGKNDKPKMINF